MTLDGSYPFNFSKQRHYIRWLTCLAEITKECHACNEKPPHTSSVMQVHSDSKWLKLARNKFTQSDFTSFNKKVSVNLHYFRFRSLPKLHIKSCQIVAVAIMFRQFHEFFESSSWRVFENWPNCALLSNAVPLQRKRSR